MRSLAWTTYILLHSTEGGCYLCVSDCCIQGILINAHAHTTVADTIRIYHWVEAGHHTPACGFLGIKVSLYPPCIMRHAEWMCYTAQGF